MILYFEYIPYNNFGKLVHFVQGKDSEYRQKAWEDYMEAVQVHMDSLVAEDRVPHLTEERMSHNNTNYLV